MVNNFFTLRSDAAVGGRIRRYVAATLGVIVSVIASVIVTVTLGVILGGTVAGSGRPGGRRTGPCAGKHNFLAKNISSLKSHFK